MLRASAHRLDRSPHVPISRQQIPPGCLERLATDSSRFVNGTRRSGRAIVEDGLPDDIAVPAHNSVCASERVGLGRIERGMNAAEDDVGAARTRELSDFVPAKRVPGMDPDADDIARSEQRGVKGIQCFISDGRLAKSGGRGAREHIQPPRRDHRRAEGHMTRVDEKHTHSGASTRSATNRTI